MDIDLDFPSNFDANKVFKEAVPASLIKKEELSKHNCGQYFQTIPIDSVTGLAAIPYTEAEELGFFKIDFLHTYCLDTITSKEEIRDLITKEPNWNLLQNETHVKKLIHINKHYSLLKKVKPKTVEELADCLSLIRPSKNHLINDYIVDKNRVRKVLYKKTDNYYFKKSHAIAYSLTIVLQLHLIAQDRL